jgi:hypothetical protein
VFFQTRLLKALVVAGSLLGPALSAALPQLAAVVSPSAAADNIVIQWDKVTLQAIRVTKPGPPQVARMLAIVDTCMFDAWAAYDRRAVGTFFGGFLRQPRSARSEANKQKAISYAAYRALVDLFPTEKTAFDLKMAELGYDPNDTQQSPFNPAGIGNLSSAAIIATRHRDGANQLGDLTPSGTPYADTTNYAPLNPAISITTPTPLDQIPYPNHWQPLSYLNPATGTLATPKFIAPHWGNVTPFALSSGAQFRPEPPSPVESPEVKAQCEELIAISANLDDRQKCIAEYWADGPTSEWMAPPGAPSKRTCSPRHLSPNTCRATAHSALRAQRS